MPAFSKRRLRQGSAISLSTVVSSDALGRTGRNGISKPLRKSVLKPLSQKRINRKIVADCMETTVDGNLTRVKEFTVAHSKQVTFFNTLI